MDIDSKFNKKTLQDEHGHYPTWMNQRAIAKQKHKNGKTKRRKKGASKGKAKF